MKNLILALFCLGALRAGAECTVTIHNGDQTKELSLRSNGAIGDEQLYIAAAIGFQVFAFLNTASQKLEVKITSDKGDVIYDSAPLDKVESVEQLNGSVLSTDDENVSFAFSCRSIKI